MSRSDTDQLFHAARALPEAERRPYLDQATGGDQALVAKVEALLAADADAGSFLDLPDAPGESGAPAAVAGAEVAGDRIGPFRLLQEIGEGGMGTVWMAEQQEPIRRKVALKIIKLGMDTREVVVRFEAERQALALMEHPHIARVIDGGATDAGRPYFVMELVRGVPITEYCDQAKLGLRERLELFSKVCEAVQHAHHKGIIHRDIKPSNVMVTLHDGVPVPKVIDFGIAKATSAELTQKTLFTQYAQIIGTPEYMAPEQAEMSGLDIDTRADVYSLGVLLYELLTGSKPFDIRKALAAGYDELLRTIREVDPAKPSTRVSNLGEAATPVAAGRQVNVDSLSKRLRGDLDWIVMKALEKNRTRRYETANSFAADIARYLADEAVEAVPPSAGYQLKKFVRRNRGRVVAAGLLAVTLVAGLAGTTGGLLWAVEQKGLAEDARGEAVLAQSQAEAAREEALAARDSADEERERAEAARTLAVEAEGEAQRELTRANETKRLITDMLASAQPAIALGADTVLLEAILTDTGDRLLAGEVEDDLIAAELHQVLAEVYEALADQELADRHGTLAYELRLPLLELDHPDLRSSMWAMSLIHQREGRHAAALELGRQVVEAQRAAIGHEPDAELMLGGALANLAYSLSEEDLYEEAEEALLEALEVQGRTYGDLDPFRSGMLRNLALLYAEQGRWDEAAARREEAIAADRGFFGLDHPMIYGNICDTATALYESDRLAEAEATVLLALEGQERILPEDHPDLLASRELLVAIYDRTGRSDEARALRETLPSLDDLVDPGSTKEELEAQLEAVVERASRRVDDAVIDETLALHRLVHERYGEEDELSYGVSYYLSWFLQVAGREAEAVALMPAVVAFLEGTAGKEDESTRDELRRMALLLEGLERLEEAEAAYLDVLARDVAAGAAETESALGSRTNLGQLYLNLGRMDEAIELLEASLEAKRRVLGMDHEYTRIALRWLHECYVETGRLADQQALERELYGLAVQDEIAKDPGIEAVGTGVRALLEVEEHLKNPELALELAEDLMASDDHAGPMLVMVRETLALALFANGRVDEAIALAETALADAPGITNEVMIQRIENDLERYKAARSQE